MLKIKTDYPSFDQEVQIVDMYAGESVEPEVKPIMTRNDIQVLQEYARKMPIANDIKKYAVELVHKTRRKKELIEYGASPRASIGLILAGKARALIEGRKYVSMDDIQKSAYPILRHRIILSFEAERNNMEADDVIAEIIKK